MYISKAITYFLADRKLIAKKRQDTKNICRIFNNENERLNLNIPKKLVSGIRNKRAVLNPISNVNPVLNEEDAQRVEKIVEKLYDDLEENGEKVTYRRLQYSTPTVTTPVRELT